MHSHCIAKSHYSSNSNIQGGILQVNFKTRMKAKRHWWRCDLLTAHAPQIYAQIIFLFYVLKPKYYLS